LRVPQDIRPGAHNLCKGKLPLVKAGAEAGNAVAQGFKLDVAGRCICDPTTAGPGCAYCVVPGSCGNPQASARANLNACADFGQRRSYGPAYNFVRDPVTRLSRCVCNPASTPHCAACIFPGVCKYCNAPFELVDGKCGAPLLTCLFSTCLRLTVFWPFLLCAIAAACFCASAACA
jgi:hypothetical protein